MRRSLSSVLPLLATLIGTPALAQTAPDPVADSIVRNLTRGLRIPGHTGDSVIAPRTPTDGPVQARTTAPPDQPAVSLMVVFATGSATLTPQAEALIASLAHALASPDLAHSRFRIEGHTDAVGTMSSNQVLSERRAATVREVLIMRFGVDGSRIEAMGLGETRLLIPTSDGRAESRNRRVQVINLGE